MAIDVYVQIDGIKGESTDSQHAGWIECASVNWKLHQPRSATASTSGGHTAERAELSDVAFTKLAEIASPILAQYCAMGKTMPKAKFEFFRADGQGTRVKFGAALLRERVGHRRGVIRFVQLWGRTTCRGTSTRCAMIRITDWPVKAAMCTGRPSSAGSGSVRRPPRWPRYRRT